MPVWFQPMPMSKPIAFDLNRMQYNVNLDTFEPMDPFFAASRRLSTDMTDNTQPLVPIRAPLVRRPGSSCSISSTSSESTVVPPIHNKNYQESRYKTELCRHFEENGTCPHGTQCLFAHGLTELRPFRGRHRKFKTQLCKAFHSDGFCSFGPRCSYIHTGADVIPALVQQHKDRFANKLDNGLFRRPAMARENAIPIQMPPKVQTRDSELALAAQMRLSVFANICNN